MKRSFRVSLIIIGLLAVTDLVLSIHQSERINRIQKAAAHAQVETAPVTVIPPSPEVLQAAKMVSRAKEILAEVPTKPLPKVQWVPGRWQTYKGTWYAVTGKTASGTWTQDYWTVAADPRYLPLGTVIEILFPNGDTGLGQVQDTGALVKGRHIDIYYHNYNRDVTNGRKTIKIRILVKG